MMNKAGAKKENKLVKAFKATKSEFKKKSRISGSGRSGKATAGNFQKYILIGGKTNGA